jgi:Tol biopolymer transport system component
MRSPDGSKIVFASNRKLYGSDAFNTRFARNIWLANSDGTGAIPLTKLTASGADSFDPVWSPDGTKIVFSSHRALDGSDASNVNFTSNIWVVNADGTAATPLTKITAVNADSFFPGWSPNGTKVTFESARKLDGSDAANVSFTYNIWVVNTDATGAIPLTKLTAFNAHSLNPVWSPDGSKIAFQSSRKSDGTDSFNTNFTKNIWVVNADGTGAIPLTKLTAGNADSVSPTWSSDGSRIFFHSARKIDGSDAANTNVPAINIWVINADGSAVRPLTIGSTLGGQQ